MASHHYDSQKSRRRAAPMCIHDVHTRQAARTLLHLRTEQPLGFQTFEGEITLRQGPQGYEKAAGAAKSLAPTRSNSYSPTDASDFRSLSAGTPADEDSDRREPAKMEQNDNATTRDEPSASAHKREGPTGSAMDTATPPRGDEDRQGGSDKGARAKQAQAFRRSPRLRPEEGKHSEGPEGSGATGALPRATTAAPQGAAAGATSGEDEVSHNSNGFEGSQDGDGGDDNMDMDSGNGTGGLRPVPRATASVDCRDPSRGAASANYSHTARIERLESRIHQPTKMEQAAADMSQRKSLVNAAEATALLPWRATDPNLWGRLPTGNRTKALNQANAIVWSSTLATPGHAHSHLLGQLSKGDGEGTWECPVCLHTDKPNARAHQLRQPTSNDYECFHKHTAPKHSFGGVLRFAEAFQMKNRLHELASGNHVHPEILMQTLVKLKDHAARHRQARKQHRASRAKPTDIPRQEQRGTHGYAHGAWTQKKGRTDHSGICHRYGKPECCTEWHRNDVSAAHAARRTQTKQKPKVKLTHAGPESDRYDGRNRGPSRARALRRGSKPDISSQPQSRRRRESQAREELRRGNRTAEIDTVIIDSGASESFCMEGTPLENVRAACRTISSAGNQTLEGRAVGDWGCLKSTVTVRNLRQGLASVGRMTDDHQAILLFTSNKVYAVPERHLGNYLQAKYEIGERDDRGLYTSTIQQINEVLSLGRGFRSPRQKGVGASATPYCHAAEGRGRHYALTVLQETTNQSRAQIPKHVCNLSRHLRYQEGRLQRRGPSRTKGVHPLKQPARGVRPSHPVSNRTTSGGCGDPTKGREGQIEPQKRRVRFIDLCCGIGGFTSAGILAGWEPVASVDFCKSLAKDFVWNFAHPFERVNLIKKDARMTLTNK
ncbi:hypothetical protein CBD41_06710, partial [bacterium TMED181]